MTDIYDFEISTLSYVFKHKLAEVKYLYYEKEGVCYAIRKNKFYPISFDVSSFDSEIKECYIIDKYLTNMNYKEKYIYIKYEDLIKNNIERYEKAKMIISKITYVPYYYDELLRVIFAIGDIYTDKRAKNIFKYLADNGYLHIYTLIQYDIDYCEININKKSDTYLNCILAYLVTKTMENKFKLNRKELSLINLIFLNTTISTYDNRFEGAISNIIYNLISNNDIDSLEHVRGILIIHINKYNLKGKIIANGLMTQNKSMIDYIIDLIKESKKYYKITNVEHIKQNDYIIELISAIDIKYIREKEIIEKEKGLIEEIELLNKEDSDKMDEGTRNNEIKKYVNENFYDLPEKFKKLYNHHFGNNIEYLSEWGYLYYGIMNRLGEDIYNTSSSMISIMCSMINLISDDRKKIIDIKLILNGLDKIINFNDYKLAYEIPLYNGYGSTMFKYGEKKSILLSDYDYQYDVLTDYRETILSNNMMVYFVFSDFFTDTHNTITRNALFPFGKLYLDGEMKNIYNFEKKINIINDICNIIEALFNKVDMFSKNKMRYTIKLRDSIYEEVPLDKPETIFLHYISYGIILTSKTFEIKDMEYVIFDNHSLVDYLRNILIDITKFNHMLYEKEKELRSIKTHVKRQNKMDKLRKIDQLTLEYFTNRNYMDTSYDKKEKRVKNDTPDTTDEIDLSKFNLFEEDS
jgi:hypothetical protein